MGGDSKTTDTSQSSVTNPWAPAQPLLQNILGSLGGINTGVTSGQSTALGNLNSAASGLPDFSSGVTGAVNGALGTNTSPQQGMLSGALSQYQGNLGSTANGSELNPYSTPGFSDALGTMTNDITKQVAGSYAGSGRDPSGAGSFSGSLARGLTQGEAPVIQAQYNQNKANQMNAATSLYGAAGSTASGLTSQQLAQIQGQGQGLTEAGATPGLLTGNANAQLGAANASYNQPLSNIQGLEGLTTPIAGLGGQSSGTGTSTTTSSNSLYSNILGGLSGLSGLNGAMGSGWLSSLGPSLAMLSDERAKENIEPVGEMHDGQTVYSYNYKGENDPQIGLLAQEVEKWAPEAVVERPDGLKAVRYDIATRKSREMGGWLNKMAA